VCELDLASGLLPEHLAADRRLGYTSFLGVPLRVRDRTVGVLSFRGRRPFTRADQELAEAFAGQAAIAIDNARLYREAETQAEHMRAVAELGRALVSTFEVGRILEMVSTHVRDSLGIMEAGIGLEDPETGRLRFVVGQAVAADAYWSHDLGPGEGVAGLALAQGRVVWTSDILTDPAITLRAETRARLAEAGSRAILAVPLMRGRPFGALVVHRGVGHQFGQREVEYLSMFANQVAVAVQNARLYAETRRRLEETRALLEVEEILNSPLEPSQRLKQVAIRIAQVCRVDRCTIERWDGDRVLPLMSQFADGRRDDRLWAHFSQTPVYATRDVAAYARILDTRRPVTIPDTASTDLIPRSWIETFGHRSALLVPLARQDAVIGVMMLDRVEIAAPFEAWQVELAAAIAGQLALSIENTRLYTEVQERLRETSTLLAVGQALSQPSSPVEVMRQVARELAQAFKADMVGVCVMDQRREALVPLAGYHVPKHLVQGFLAQPFVLERSPWLRDAIVNGRGAWTADIAEEPGVDRGTFAAIGHASVLLAPTTVRGEPGGALVLVWWDSGRVFDAAEVRLIEGVAGQVGLAMEIADLVRQSQQKRQETETLLSVSHILASTLDLEALPRQLLRHVVRALGGDMGGIWLLDESGEALVPLVGYHVPTDILAAFRRLRISIVEPSMFSDAVRSRRPALSRDSRHDPRMPAALRAVGHDRADLFVPIIVKDRIMGGLGVSWHGGGRELAEAELRLVEMVASQAGVALQNAQLFRDNQRRVEELSVLHQVSRVVTGQLDQRGLVEAVREGIARVLDVRFLVVLLLDDAGERLDVVLRIRDGLRVDAEPRGYPRRGAGLSTVVLDIGRPIRTTDYATECLRYGVEPTPASASLPNWLGVPMAAGDRLLGVLVLRSPDRPFTVRDERLLTNIADLVALALRSAQLYEERSRAYGELAAAHDQLVRTEKLRAMGEMASGVAHDFNNVLAAILGRAQLLRDKVDDPKLKRWIEVIERSAMDGAQTVKRLQEFTRIRRDQPVVAVDLNQVVQETLEATEPSWRDGPRRRGVEIEATLALAPSLPRVSGDPAELRDAMTNLVLNAVDAMPRGGRLTMGTARVGELVEVTVSDTGVGIPEAIRQRIFDPFFTTKGPKGTGLGLSMAYGILGRHGARITVESEEGRGTSFRLLFRPAEGSMPAVAPEATAPDAPGGLHCLVVDDEESVGEVLGDMLGSAGHSAVVVGSGSEALGRLGAERFDVVFTDLAMPGMSGWDVARAVKGTPAAMPVVLVTGFGVEVAPEDLAANGVDAVLAKPLRLNDIQRALASVRCEPGEGGGAASGGGAHA
jgi:GAF domain-containing protein/ActR/RegA family two-component response regulator